MSDNPSPAASDAGPSSPQATLMTVPPWRWGVCLLAAAVAAWTLLNFTPIEFDLPEELRDVDMYSPVKLQEAEAEQVPIVKWQNTLTKFGFVGFCFGAVALLAVAGAGTLRRWVAAVLGLISGVGCGALVAVLGSYLMVYFGSKGSLSMVGESSRMLVEEIGIFMLASVLLVVPVSLAVVVGGGKQCGQKGVSILLAGVVTGLLVPFAASLAIPNSKTGHFPPEGLVLTAIWLAALAGLVFAFTTLTGTRRSKTRSGGQEGAA